MTLDEASFYVAATLNEIAAREGRAMHITDIHSVVRTHGGQVSIYLDVDPPGVDCGVGGESCIIVLVDERAVLDMNQAELLRALMVVTQLNIEFASSCKPPSLLAMQAGASLVCPPIPILPRQGCVCIGSAKLPWGTRCQCGEAGTVPRGSRSASPSLQNKKKSKEKMFNVRGGTFLDLLLTHRPTSGSTQMLPYRK